MHYQSKLWPIDEVGGFVLAITHNGIAIGGEDTRETAYTAFSIGHLDRPNELRNITELCVMVRPAHAKNTTYELQSAQAQAELAAKAKTSYADMYRHNAMSGFHRAALSERDGIRVPRRVLFSRSGRLLLGFKSPSTKEDLPGVLRLVNLLDTTIQEEWSTPALLRNASAKGSRRFLAGNLGEPVAVSDDATEVIMWDAADTVSCALTNQLPENAQATRRMFQVSPTEQGWVATDHDAVIWLDRKLTELRKVKLPSGANYWPLTTCRNGEFAIVASKQSADFWLVPRIGKARRFSPHRGAGRDANFGDLAISDCGRYVVSRVAGDISVTRLEDGMSLCVGQANDEIHQDRSFGDFEVHSRVPAAVGWLGSRLAVAERGIVRELEVEPFERNNAFVSEHGRAGARKTFKIKSEMALDEMLKHARIERHSTLLARLHSPAVKMNSIALKKSGWLMPEKEKSPALAASRLGGWPDMPAGVSWPTWQERPMAFLAQINLAEVALINPHLKLPKAGLLSFFLGCDEQTYKKGNDQRLRYMADLMLGTEAKTNDAWRVTYHPLLSDMQRSTFNGPIYPELFEPCSLSFFASGLSMPDENTAIYPALKVTMNASELTDYDDILSQLKSADKQMTEQLMGYPQLLQFTPPEMQCELSFRGQDPWQFPAARSEAHKELVQRCNQWTLLLQLTSNSAADFLWGDAGHFYFYGDRDAMERGDFSKVWVNFEN